MNINKAIVIGRITQNLELKNLPSGMSVLNFSVATNYTYKDQNNNKVEETEFHNVVVFGKTAENIARYFVRGQEIYVEGRLKTRTWDDKESGKKMYRTEIILEKFEFGAKPNGGDNQNSYPQNNNQNFQQAQQNNDFQKPSSDEIEYPTDDVDPEDIPF